MSRWKDNICMDCIRDGRTCSWIRNETPVKGWSATPSVIKFGDREIETFYITKCPLYIEHKDTRLQRHKLLIPCPDCGGESAVINQFTHKDSKGKYIVKHRECLACHNKFSTKIYHENRRNETVVKNHINCLSLADEKAYRREYWKRFGVKKKK